MTMSLGLAGSQLRGFGFADRNIYRASDGEGGDVEQRNHASAFVRRGRKAGISGCAAGDGGCCAVAVAPEKTGRRVQLF